MTRNSPLSSPRSDLEPEEADVALPSNLLRSAKLLRLVQIRIVHTNRYTNIGVETQDHYYKVFTLINPVCFIEQLDE